MQKIIFLFFLISSTVCLDYEVYNNTEDLNISKILNTSLKAGICSVTELEAQQFIYNNDIDYDMNKIDRNVKFVVGPCNPVVLVPGIYSTKMRVKINCKKLKIEQKNLYQKIKLYCNKYVCSDDEDNEENRDLWFSLGTKGFTLLKNIIEPGKENNNENVTQGEENDLEGVQLDWDNLYSGCIGLFMTMFDKEDECPELSTGKKACGYSNNIKVTYDGGFINTKDIADCGVKAVENVLISPLTNLPDSLWKKKSNVFGDLADELVEYGYTKGFSLAAIPNDFRQFISKNDFAYDALKYHIENMYNLTGKPVIIIAHSFGNLVTLNGLNKYPDLEDKVKKWISLAPPFGGATKAVENFIHGITDFNFDVVPKFSRSEFHKFGQFLMLKSIPTVYELKPYTVFYKLFNSVKYSGFAEAIRKRIALEKECRNKQCDKSYIGNNSAAFDNYFKDYFPSLTLDECAYEASIGGNQEANNKKCFTELFNMVDYPSIVKVDSTSQNNNIEDYYQVFNENTYYIAENEDIKDTNGKTIDDLFAEVPYVYDAYDTEIKDLIQRYNTKYKKSINKNSQKYFETKAEFTETIKKMIAELKNISIIKDLPKPNVDIDIVYGNFMKTLAAEFIDKTTGAVKDKDTVNKGGDGTVPSWSSLLTGLKWIYESQLTSNKYRNKNVNIRLVEYCSRLADTSLNLPNFKAISCRCIENNVYKNDLDDCSHQFMLGDKAHLFEYISEELGNDDENVTNKKNAIEFYPTVRENDDYLNLCNLKLYKLSNKEVSKKCVDGMTITERDFKRNHCYLEGYASLPHKDCCNVHVKGTDVDYEQFDSYYCYNIKNNEESKNEFIADTKAKTEFYDELSVTVYVECPPNYSNPFLKISFKELVLLLFLILY